MRYHLKSTHTRYSQYLYQTQFCKDQLAKSLDKDNTSRITGSLAAPLSSKLLLNLQFDEVLWQVKLLHQLI